MEPVQSIARLIGPMLEDSPTRDVEKLALAEPVEVRFMKNLLNFGTSSNCNEQQCPMVRQRLYRHLHEHHSSPGSQRTPVQQALAPAIKVHDRAVSANSLTELNAPTLIMRQLLGARSVQTELTLEDLSKLDYFQKKKTKPKKSVSLLRKVSSRIKSVKEGDMSLRVSETRSVIPEKSFYKEHLKDIVIGWLKNVPMSSNITPEDKEVQENIVNNLVEKVYNLSVNACDSNYKDILNIEIDICLKKLPMWSGNGKSQTKLNTGLKEKLWLKISNMNKKYLIDTDTNIDINEVINKTIDKAESSQQSRNIKMENSDNSEKSVQRTNFEKEIIEWLGANVHGEKINTLEVAGLILKRLMPLMKFSVHNAKYKLVLKGDIFEILDNLPLNPRSGQSRVLFLNRCAEDLANRLISIRIKNEVITKLYDIELNSTVNCIENDANYKGPFKVTKLLDILEEEISSTVIEETKSFHCRDVKNKHYYRDVSLQGSVVSEDTTNDIPGNINDAMNNDKVTATGSRTIAYQMSGLVSVYTSTEYPFAATSTPKKSANKDIPKLNTDEIKYMDKVADVIRTWMETLPKQYNEDKNYKETLIYDLAGDIMDEVKLQQLSPDIKSDSDKYLSYITHRWLCRFNFFEDLKRAKPLVNDFIKKLIVIPTPKLTIPQHGSRQTMRNIQHMQGEMRAEDFIPQGIDVLEDQISVWMNEQPSQIYAKKDKAARSKQVHDLALALQDRLRNKSPESEIDQDINEWLKYVVNPKEKEHIGILTQNLKEKIMNTPQDETLEGRVAQMKRDRADYFQAKERRLQGLDDQVDVGVESQINAQDDPDKTMKEFISMFIEHNYDIADPMARGAFGYLLKTELRKLNPLTRKEVYYNLSKSGSHEEFGSLKFSKELEYIQFISDWLKNIPIAPTFNAVGNRHRVDYVVDLAKNILEAEDLRLQDPSQMDYDVFIASVISISIRTYELPILPEYKKNEKLIVDQLMNKIIALRTNDSLSTSIKTDSSIRDETGNIEQQDISEFIERYVRINGIEIADDAVKLEAWSTRLLKEIKKMIHENEDPNTLCKAQVYNRFIDVPIPGEESVKLFGLELEYVKEISEWLVNLPLLPIDNDPQAQRKRIQMISELADKMVERTVKKKDFPDDANVDMRTVEYINDWISKLPLDNRQEIVLPIITQQLLNRIDRVNKKDQLEDSLGGPSYSNTNSKEKQSKSPKERQPNSSNTSKGQKDPGKVIVEGIDHWCNKLPIQGDTETAKSIKDNVAKKIYQKIGELNVDPIIYNDDVLYHEMLEDEIDTQLDNVPQNANLQNQRKILKTGLIETILDAKKSAKANAAGEDYKHKLETTIDASIPNPIRNSHGSDPGFDIYKNHLANIFILDNFDHGSDETKTRYEKKIKDEIDKYSENAQSKNAIPLSKDQIYNEVYSSLFEVPLPSGKAVMDEVEEVKTRCEIQSWFNELPLKEASRTSELLERDKIITTLAKRIHDIEKESKPDEKIRVEINKWLNKLPLLPGHEDNKDQLTKDLLNALKLTATARKCVTTEPKSKDDSKRKSKSGGILGTSQIAGPSSAGQNWVSPPPPCCSGVKPSFSSQQKPADLIIEVVEDWSKQIPLIMSAPENKVIEDNLTTNIIMKISELNTNPEIFDNDIFYYELLDEELDKLLSDLPTETDFRDSIPARKYQLIEMVKSIKPLIREEKAKHEYKEDLKNAINTILMEPQNTTEEKLALFNDLKNDVIENFMQYYYNRDDEQGREIYRTQVYDDVVKYFSNIMDKGSSVRDPLIVRNQLLCELGKISIPSVAALKDTVEEIKMKKEVEGFFKNLPPLKGDTQQDTLRKQLIVSLAKRLNDLEKSGHSSSTEQKMKSEISRCLKKLDIQTNPQAIEAFVDLLKDNEASRKVPPSPKTIDMLTKPGDNSSQIDRQVRHQTNQSPLIHSCPNSNQGAYNPEQTSASNQMGKSFVPASPCQMTQASPQHPRFLTDPAQNPQFYKTYENTSSIDQEFSPSKRVDRSLDQADVSYNDFSERVTFKSSIGPVLQNSPGSEQPRVAQGSPYCSSVPTPQSMEMMPSSHFIGPHVSQVENFPSMRMPNSNDTQSQGAEFSQGIPSRVEDRGALRRSLAESDGVCSCVKRILKNCNGRPHCKIEIDEYCDECGGFGPMWWRISPGFIFY